MKQPPRADEILHMACAFFARAEVDCKLES